MKQCIVVLNTMSLPTTTPGIDRWMYTNAMHCLAWLTNKIATFCRHINPDKLWYEEANNHEEWTIADNNCAKQFNVAAIAQVTSQELVHPENSDMQPVASRSVIHRSFEFEFT